MRRRALLVGAGLGAATTALPLRAAAQANARVVVVGGGFGGAAAAKYLRRFNPQLDLTLIEPNEQFVSCPLSSRVLHGGVGLRDLTWSYARFTRRHDLRWVRAAAEGIDAVRREVQVGKERVGYDRLVLAPGVEFVYDGIAGMESPAAQARVPHAWRAGSQTQRLKELLLAMRAGGVVAMHIPFVPYRCPPGPYERATLIAGLLAERNPRGKLLVFDSNPGIQAKKGLFERLWRERHAQHLEYVPNAEVQAVDAVQGIIDLKVQGRHRFDVLNLIPPQRAAALARQAGLATVAQRWCGVDFLSYASVADPAIHVIGDALASAPGSPKSGHMANQQAKVCASAIAAATLGLPPLADPIIANTCYSFVSPKEAIHVAAVYRYSPEKRTMLPVPEAGGLSEAPSMVEGIFAMGWLANILSDTFE